MTFIDRQLDAFSISVNIIESLLNSGQTEALNSQLYSKDDLAAAADTLKQLRDKCEKIRFKFKLNSPQMTLLLRRQKAFNIVLSIINV